MAEVLNLNNEVVKMRKEVKKARALIIRKVSRQISALKQKKGCESEVQKNQRRVARLLEEINQMKNLKPDHVTKEALQKNLCFEKVCKDPKSTLVERATARIASHPQISKRIEELKAAVKAFNDERKKTQGPGKPVKHTGEDVGKPKNLATGDRDTDMCDAATQDQSLTEEGAKSTCNVTVETSSREEGLSPLDEIKVTVPLEGSSDSKAKQRNGETSAALRNCQALPKKGKEVPAENQFDLKKTSFPAVKAVKEPENKKDEESDLEPSDDEEVKEYFDDSTEERFYRQSSQSEDSDDDFFLGKVSKGKKKRRTQSDPEQSDSIPSAAELLAETNEAGGYKGKEKQDGKAVKLETVFCRSLSGSRQAPLGAARGGSKPSRFQGSRTGALNRKLALSTNQWDSDQQRGKGRAQFGNPQGHRAPAGKGVAPSQNAQQVLHPSWEASKRRKEQQAQIMAFQGKKIKFDDD
ncbi:serum response factor-binding protein 1 isoform X1 [Scleropages formosus]|uniref:Serum response factor-binding protein 1 n=1 Tax=Scleropages formosus TaxID=113540 RepID=A0A8C9QSE8_SCLFO|nr:serum response factor-binding protein 1 isoform X1 [Scleropages formosus]XP_029104244.1 serum response factor-binding protein 1 isoform X1 [Scleropages formosus]